MKTALVISSFVGASHVGAAVSAFCLRRLGIKTYILPTTLFGRHPGWGSPGGSAVNAQTLLGMWTGLDSQNTHIDAVLTGYLASPEQVEVAAMIIDAVIEKNPKAKIIVDPVMGDHGKLYVPKPVADCLIAKLVARAHIITPNAWELAYITQDEGSGLQNIAQKIRRLKPMTLVTSVTKGEDIGALFFDKENTYLTAHKKFSSIPHGGGDALAGIFLARLLQGFPPQEALALALGGLFEIISVAAMQNLNDLPLIQYQDFMVNASPLPLERLSYD